MLQMRTAGYQVDINVREIFVFNLVFKSVLSRNSCRRMLWLEQNSIGRMKDFV